MTFEVDDPEDLQRLTAALWRGQESMQLDWERSLTTKVPEEVQAILWERWSLTRRAILKLGLLP